MRRAGRCDLEDFQIQWLTEADKPKNETKQEQLQRWGKARGVGERRRREGASVRREETSKLKVEEAQKFFIGTSDNRVFIL